MRKFCLTISILLLATGCEQSPAEIQTSGSTSALTQTNDPITPAPAPSPTPSASPTPTYKFSGGSGTPEDPYLISTSEDFQKIATNLSASYSLINDINMRPTPDGTIPIISPIGDAQHPFSGTFDGNGYMIDHLFINADSGPTSLFISVTGKIQDIYFLDMTLKGNGPFAPISNYLGGSIENIHVESRSLDPTGSQAMNATWGAITYRYDELYATISNSVACVNNGADWAFFWGVNSIQGTAIPGWTLSTYCTPLTILSERY